MKTNFIFTPAALAILAFGGCAQSGPDYTPIGSGLTAIAIALVVFGVVGALADLIRSGEKPPNSSSRTRPRRPRGSKPRDRR